MKLLMIISSMFFLLHSTFAVEMDTRLKVAQKKIDHYEKIIKMIDGFIENEQNFKSTYATATTLKKSEQVIADFSYKTKNIYVYKVKDSETRSWSELTSKLIMLKYEGVDPEKERNIVKGFKKVLKYIRVLVYYKMMRVSDVYEADFVDGLEPELNISVEPRNMPSVIWHEGRMKNDIGRNFEKLIRTIDGEEYFQVDANDPNIVVKGVADELIRNDELANELNLYLNNEKERSHEKDIEWIGRLAEEDYFKNWSFKLEISYGDNPDISFEDMYLIIKSKYEDIRDKKNLDLREKLFLKEVKKFIRWSYATYVVKVVSSLEREHVSQTTAIKVDKHNGRKRMGFWTAYYAWKASDIICSGVIDIMGLIGRGPLEINSIRILDLINDNMGHAKKMLADLEKDGKKDFRKEKDITVSIAYLEHLVESYPMFMKMQFKSKITFEQVVQKIIEFQQKNISNTQIIDDFLPLVNKFAHSAQSRLVGFLIPAMKYRIRDMEAHNWQLHHNKNKHLGHVVRFGNNIIRKGEVMFESIEKYVMKWTDNLQLRKSHKKVLEYIKKNDSRHM